MTRRRPRALRSRPWQVAGAVALLGALGAPAACSGDEHGGRGADDAGDAGVDGAASSGGGSSAAGGAGVGGSAGGSGARGSGGSPADASSGGATAEAGPACTPLADIPPPVVTTADVKATCSAPAGCGGTVDGTDWAYSDVCFDESAVFAEAFAQCPTAQFNGATDFDVAGSLAFAGGRVTHHLSAKGTGVFQMPAECAACDCKGFQDVLIRNGAGANTFCYQDCYPDSSCRCLVDFDVEITEDDTYTTSGSSVVLGSGRTYSICASATELSLREQGTSPALAGTATLIPTSALASPEICDGVDNDRNGKVDDAPLDCPPPCLTQGVCAGTRPACTAAAWVCDYGSSYEAGNETICDGLDNDCDGTVDEGLVGCVELCDGLDNDNDGTVDDSPEGSPCSATLGVCAGTETSVCGGKAGWHCASSSTAYEPAESRCDGLDNDCDGSVDEGCSCATGKSKLYVAHWGGAPALLRADLDGKNQETIAGLSGFALSGLVIDSKADRIYFYDGTKIRRAHLDGTVLEDVWTGDTQRWAIDPSTGGIFTECGTSNICRSSIAAPGTKTTLLQPAAVAGMSLDAVNRVLYWSDYAAGYSDQILRVGLDGSGVTGVLKLPLSPLTLLVDPAGQKIYWPDNTGIYQAGLDGSNPKPLVAIPSSYTYDMAVDFRGGKLYFTDVNANEVRRVGLNGAGLETLVTGVDYPVAVALYVCAP